MKTLTILYVVLGLLGLFLKMAFIVFVFLPIYVLLCPYAFHKNVGYEDHINYLNHFEDLL